ncbi:DUF2062 domain-containing protein [Hymenobacter sp. 15J16-1T3B]|uniref:DUF2062 domain-containing protein n=1 Tax=Hymenobacter sp. 15J16-1T3B TaxID=2886941 RepID=UPI001D11404E|nr:DUF2062 domain-containing protein [Hymenobacter sp. 15J16-1T3B]MCC3160044.1 DUF2062 domain-containing protein [Hymenobacter sp. 15J16-1T3B]
MSTETVTPQPGFFRRRVVEPLLGQLRKGLSPTQLALTVSLGAAFGLVPLLGVTTVLGTAVAVWLRLNVGALLLVSHLMSPVQILLLLPLLRYGAQLLGGATRNLTLERLQYLLSHDWQAALQLFWRAEVGALLLWLLGSVPVVLVLYFLLLPLFRRVAQRQAAQEAATAAEA